jgi:ABC-type polar amino acid transport system ATPase subunit
MNIKIIENNKPNLHKIKFNCDEKICDKLDKFPMIRDHLNKYNTTLFVGRQGSGKSSLVINFIKQIYRKKFHKVYVFMPETSRSSLQTNIFEVLPEEQLFEELNGETISLVYEQIKENRKNGLKSLILFDDVQKALKDPDVLKSLQNIIANQRHLSVVNFILAQNFFNVDPKIREIINNLIFFKMDKKQTEKIFNNLVEIPKEKYNTLINSVFDNNYNWCMINIGSKRMYKLFDEIVFIEESDNEIEI